MRKLLLVGLTLVTVIAGVTAALAAQTGDAAGGQTTTTSTTSTQGIDISGNCDEAEHAQDPECIGVLDGDLRERGDDDRGRDHPEDDPEPERVDNSGPGSVSSHDDDLVEDDDVDDDDDGFDDDTGTGPTNTATGTNTGGHGG